VPYQVLQSKDTAIYVPSRMKSVAAAWPSWYFQIGWHNCWVCWHAQPPNTCIMPDIVISIEQSRMWNKKGISNKGITVNLHTWKYENMWDFPIFILFQKSLCHWNACLSAYIWCMQLLLLHGWCMPYMTSFFTCLIFLVAQTRSHWECQ